MNKCCGTSCGCSKKGGGNIPAILLVTGVLGLLALLGSCGDKPLDPLDYDKSAMLTNMVDGVILDNYSNLRDRSDELTTAALTMVNEPTLTDADITDARTRLKSLRKAWQRASMFEFGPAANVSLRSQVNTYPTDTNQILSNIAAGSWDLAIASNADAIGLPALAYLLHGQSLSQTTAALNADPNRKTLLYDLAQLLQSQVEGVIVSYDQSYTATFKAADGNDAGSSISFLVNELNFDLELAKNGQLGIPLGKKTLGQTLPGHVEAFHGGYSSELIEDHLEGLYDAYRGAGPDGTDGDGLHEILVGLGTQYNGGLLADTIDYRFRNAINQAAALQDPLSVQVDADPSQGNLVHSEIQRLVVLLKTDMPSALGVLITYQDNDGD